MQNTKYALISVFDKTGIYELAENLEAAGYVIIATGNTYNLLKSSGIKSLKKIDEITGFPEILDGRVKTLHPAIFGGILSIRDNESHKKDMQKNGISGIDFVVVNLYPFKEMKDKDITFDEKIEFIDIGGVSLIRAAAKNFKDVTVVANPSFYPEIIRYLKEKKDIPADAKKNYAYDAFRHTAEYDSEISGFLKSGISDAVNTTGPKEPEPASGTSPIFQEELTLGIRKSFPLRYGENPHQKAAFYSFEDSKNSGAYTPFVKLAGKEISYNNLLDIDAAMGVLKDFSSENKFFSVIIKHTNPCGAAISPQSLKDAFLKARKTDEVSSYGGIIGFNKALDEETATEIKPFFVEIILAPDYSEGALKILEGKKNTIIIRYSIQPAMGMESLYLKSAAGGILIQEKDEGDSGIKSFKTVTSVKMPENIYNDLIFAWKIAKHVKSNAIVYATGGATAGIGAGQMSRIDSAVFGYEKMKNAYGTVSSFVMASDGFFPFKDSVEYASKIGVTGIIQPGGSIRDEEVIKEADSLNIPMIFTGIRHFRH